MDGNREVNGLGRQAMVDNIQQLKTARKTQTKKVGERKCTDTCHQTSE